jgi:hypothetical protein
MIVLAAALASGAAGCTTGEGEGWVRSDRLFMADCWNGPFDLRPTFFAANPFREEILQIRVQRGDNIEEVSDGLAVQVTDIKEIRGDGEGEGLLGTRIKLGLAQDIGDGTAKVAMTLYLHDTCHAQNGTVSSLDGWIQFNSLFSGDITEAVAEDRLTDAEFEGQFANPQDFHDVDPAEATSTVRGAFSFYFQRGKPAQPFP